MMPDDQTQLIRRLLKKQDEVIDRLDQLNAEIEAVLKAALPAGTLALAESVSIGNASQAA